MSICTVEEIAAASKLMKTSSKLDTSNKIRFNNQFYNIHNIKITKKACDKSYGFTVGGYCPCHVEKIAPNGPAYISGLQQTDLIVKVNNVNCCRATLKTLLNIIKASPFELILTIYRLSNPKSRIASKLHKPSLTVKTKKTSYLGKLFRPSIKLLSCAVPLSNLLKTNITHQHSLDQTYYSKPEVQSSQIIFSSTSQIGADTGYETLSHHENLDDSNDYTIQTVTNTTNSYSDCDLTVDEIHPVKEIKIYQEQFNEEKTQLIGDLIEMEANFVSYLSMAVATLARPLRSFFMQQHDYFTLFQNIEKILIISENFLRSMDKWSALDLYTRIGQLYTQKINLFREAFTTYTKGYAKSQFLLNDLKSHSKQFRLFLNETQSGSMTINNLINLPLIHITKTLNYFKQIRRLTCESKRNPSEAPHIDSVIFELKKILTNSSVSIESLKPESFISFDEDELESCEDTFYCDQNLSNSMFMSTTINEVTMTVIDSISDNYICSFKKSSSSYSDESSQDIF